MLKPVDTDTTLYQLGEMRARVNRLEARLAAEERGPRRRARGAALLIATAVVAASVTAATSFAAPGGEAQAAALEVRISLLEQKLERPLTLKSPFTVVDSGGKKVAQIKAGRFELFDESQKAGVTLMSNLDRYGVIAGALDNSAPIVVMTATKKHTALTVLPTGGGTVTAFLGVDSSDNFARLQLENGTKIAAKLFIKDDSGRLEILGKGGKTAVSLSSAEDGGTLKAFNKQGKAVAGVFAGSDGGNLALTGPSGGKSAVSLSVEPNGGKVRVFPAGGGTARAELIADGDSGAMTVFNAEGKTATVLESGKSGAGHFVIVNAAGEIAAEAGVMQDGRGILRAGPGGFGPAGTMGSGLAPASSIQGRKKK